MFSLVLFAMDKRNETDNSFVCNLKILPSQVEIVGYFF